MPVFKRGGLLPFIDMAYQGLGRGIAEDAFGIRLFAAELPELLIAVSCSKNFGLYRERTGTLHVVNSSADRRRGDPDPPRPHRPQHLFDAAGPRRSDRRGATGRSGAAYRVARGGSVDARTHDAAARGFRRSSCARACPQRDFSFITRQLGMFSLLGITTAQVQAMRTEHHVYMTDDSRINIAGLRAGNLAYVARALAQVLGKGS